MVDRFLVWLSAGVVDRGCGGGDGRPAPASRPLRRSAGLRRQGDYLLRIDETD